MFPEAKAKNLLKGLNDRFKTDPKEENRLYQGLYRDLTASDRPKDLESWTERALSKYSAQCDELAKGDQWRPKPQVGSTVDSAAKCNKLPFNNKQHPKKEGPSKSDQGANPQPIRGECKICSTDHILAGPCKKRNRVHRDLTAFIEGALCTDCMNGRWCQWEQKERRYSFRIKWSILFLQTY